MYNHLSYANRITIHALLGQNLNQTQIAETIDVCRSTISRELKRCPGRAYDPDIAHRHATQRRSRASSVPRKLTDEVWRVFLVKVESYGSLLSAAHELPVGKTALYNRAWRDASAGSHQKPPRPRRAAKGRMPHKLMSFGVGRYKRRRSAKLSAMWAASPIARRPAIVARRGRFGDWEADTMDWGEGQKSLTMLERKSGLVRLSLLPAFSADAMMRAMFRALRGMPAKTITSDRGSEFARWRQVKKTTGAKFYASDAGCPWQRGAVEQMNGLVRRMAMADIAECGLKEALRRAQKRINTRPTPRLQWRSPAEVFRP